MTDGPLTGRAGLITGAAGGIGRGSAEQLAAAGASVAVVDRHEDLAAETVALIEKAGGTAIAIGADITDESEVERMIATTLSAFGRLDFAHNNAGIAPATGTTAECSLEDWSAVIAVDLTGVFLCMKHEIRHMLKVGGGSIVNTSSSTGLLGFPNQPAYVAAKHGIIGLTKGAAIECAAAGVRVNAICPGTTLTPLVEQGLEQGLFTKEGLASLSPMKRLAYPKDMAGTIVWLVSDASEFVTGTAIPVDGGAVASLATFWA
jgi:NAD(P)-dependent dehydrogenase (short-subunit alcohol dehydrogenase family)